MNRYCSYKKSLQKYISKRSCLKTYFNSTGSTTEIYEYIMNMVNNDNFIIPTIFLTIVNSQNKKYNISMQCYYSASAIMFYCILSKFIAQSSTICAKFGTTEYNNAINNLVACSVYSINQNMKTIKTSNHKNLFDMYINLMNIHCKLVNTNFLLKPINLTDTGIFNKKNSDINKWYKCKPESAVAGSNTDVTPLVEAINLPQCPPCNNISTENNQTHCLRKSANKFKEVKDDEYNEYVTKTLGCLCELAFTMGWIHGGGKLEEVNNIKIISKYFTSMYKISSDFATFEDDFNSLNSTSTNHVINFGIQRSYNSYIESKYQFIEKCITYEIYTSTMQEIVTIIDKNITSLVDSMSPDIMSTVSSNA